jgi:hypothetical protein
MKNDKKKYTPGTKYRKDEVQSTRKFKYKYIEDQVKL